MCYEREDLKPRQSKSFQTILHDFTSISAQCLQAICLLNSSIGNEELVEFAGIEKLPLGRLATWFS